MIELAAIPKDAIVTYSGKIVTPFDPQEDQICIEDIAYALSGMYRFTCHTRIPVAQHSVYVSQICDYPDARWGLLHDAAEAYMGDLARPLKQHSELGRIYREVEHELMRVIARKFELPWKNGSLMPLPASVKWADDVLLRSEIRDHMPFEPYPGDFYDRKIVPWSPDWAEKVFLDRWEELND